MADRSDRHRHGTRVTANPAADPGPGQIDAALISPLHRGPSPTQDPWADAAPATESPPASELTSHPPPRPRAPRTPAPDTTAPMRAASLSDHRPRQPRGRRRGPLAVALLALAAAGAVTTALIAGRWTPPSPPAPTSPAEAISPILAASRVTPHIAAGHPGARRHVRASRRRAVRALRRPRPQPTPRHRSQHRSVSPAATVFPSPPASSVPVSYPVRRHHVSPPSDASPAPRVPAPSYVAPTPHPRHASGRGAGAVGCEFPPC